MLTTLQTNGITLINELTSRMNFGTHALSKLGLISALLSDLILFFGAIILLFFISNRLGEWRSQFSTLSIVRTIMTQAALIALWSIFYLMGSGAHNTVNWISGVALFSNTYCVSFATQALKFILLLFSLLILLFFSQSPEWSKISPRAGELPLLILFTVLLGFIIISTTNLVILLLALEGFSLALYIMAATQQTQGSVTSTVKYFSYGTLGSLLLFWGTAHIYILIPSVSYSVLQLLVEESICEVSARSQSLDFATSLLLLGFIIKIGAIPAHQWVADVYTGTSMTVMAFFATIVKMVLFALFMRIAFMAASSTLIDVAIICSLFVGGYLTLQQTEIRRFLSYSSIVHVAFLFMGDALSSWVYLTTYMLSSLLLFSVLTTVHLNGKELVYLSDLRYVRQTSRWNTLLVVISLISAAGLPPFAGFYGKFSVWLSLFEDIYLFNNILTYVILSASIAVSLITIFYYTRLLAYLFISADCSDSMPVTVSYSTIIRSFQTVSAFFIVGWTAVHSNVSALSLQFVTSLLSV